MKAGDTLSWYYGYKLYQSNITTTALTKAYGKVNLLILDGGYSVIGLSVVSAVAIFLSVLIWI